MGLTKVDGFSTHYELWVNGGHDKVVVDIREHTFDDREQDMIAFYVNYRWHYIKYTDLLLLTQLAKDWRNCDHDWIDVRNEVITSGEMCWKCKRLRAGNTT